MNLILHFRPVKANYHRAVTDTGILPQATGLLMLIFLMGSTWLHAQSVSLAESTARPQLLDSNYVRMFPELLTARFYFSRKYTNLSLFDENQNTQLDYESNSTLNLGVGVTVKSFSLNLAYGFRFLNDTEERGKTRFLDLQSHIYSPRFIIDFFGQFYKGLYLENTNQLISNYPEPYYRREDIYEQIFGLTAFYLFNYSKYSFRAAMIQNERQLKSAGSWLAGFEAYYNLVLGDSALIPYFIPESDFALVRDADRINTIKAGPSGGYAHTFIIKKHFFIMLSLTLHFGVGRYAYREIGEAAQPEFGFDIGTLGRFAMGYNNDRWYLGLTSVDNSITASGANNGLRSTFGIGNVRLNYAWRIEPGPKIRKFMK